MLVSDTVFGTLLGGKGGCPLAIETVLNTFVYCWKPVIDGGFSGFRNQPADELRGPLRLWKGCYLGITLTLY